MRYFNPGKTIGVIEEMGPEVTLRPEIYKKMYLVKFRKSSKMCRNLPTWWKISFLKKSSKNFEKIQGYRSRRADSKNIVCLGWWSNIFGIFGVKFEFFEIDKNCDISIVEKRLEWSKKWGRKWLCDPKSTRQCI